MILCSVSWLSGVVYFLLEYSLFLKAFIQKSVLNKNSMLHYSVKHFYQEFPYEIESVYFVCSSNDILMNTFSWIFQVGFFGYVAFCNAGDLSGDIINHFKQNTLCDVIKLLFVFSIAVTIPLIVFPCRASLFTLFFHHVRHFFKNIFWHLLCVFVKYSCRVQLMKWEFAS